MVRRSALRTEPAAEADFKTNLKTNLKTIQDHLTRKRQLPLSADDLALIEDAGLSIEPANPSA